MRVWSFSIQTWVENVYRLFTDRNFAILDHEGNAVGYARSVWAMISMETRKPADLLTLHGVDLGQAGALLDAGAVERRVEEADVVGDGAGKQGVVLHHRADQRPGRLAAAAAQAGLASTPVARCGMIDQVIGKRVEVIQQEEWY